MRRISSTGFYTVMMVLLIAITGCTGNPSLQSDQDAIEWQGNNLEQFEQYNLQREPVRNENERLLNKQQDTNRNMQKKDAVGDQINEHTNNQSPSIPIKEKIKPASVKGIYVPGWIAGGTKMKSMLQLLQSTDLNAVVLDVKNDNGRVPYTSKIPLVKEIAADQITNYKDIQATLKQLKQNNIYTIARIVTFKDPYLAGKKPQWAMQRKSGGTWRDPKDIAWIDPYRHEVWEYNVQIAKEAARLGFDEIQFDYVRFPTNGVKVDREVQFANTQQWNKAQAIEEFLKYAKQELANDGVWISADVFGLTTSTQDDMGIGQSWDKIAPNVDYISPMVYPSHYSSGNYGIKNPDLQPYTLIKKALTDGIAKNKQYSATIRPWYQSFTAKWVQPHQTYGNQQIKEQIKAGKELGIDQFLLWNPSGNYASYE